MTSADAEDRSNGYEAIASVHMYWRERRNIGVTTVQRWARALPAGGLVLDVGCGHGVPLSVALAQLGLAVYGVDARRPWSPHSAAPFWIVCRDTWPDALTGRETLSLGADDYRAVLSDAHLTCVGEYADEGDNYYYEAVKRG